MSTSSREYSPDWLRTSQGPTTSIFTLSSSSSESAPRASEDEKDDIRPISSVIRKTSQLNSPTKKPNTKRNGLHETQGNKGNGKFAKGKSPKKLSKPQESKSSVWSLSSDSEHELSEDQNLKVEDDDDDDDDDDGGVVETSLKKASKLESSKKRLKVEDTVPAETKGKSMAKQENDDDDGDGDLKVLEREMTDEKQTGPYISSSRLPLVLSDKVQRSKVLVECEGESIDLSGDLGSVGRVVISDSPSGNQDMLLDLKGTIYRTSIVPSRTLCVVSFGQSEAKIEAIMNDFIQLKPQSNVYEAETMVEGTLEGFSFDSEDEGGDKQANRQADENEPQTNGKTSNKGKHQEAGGAGKKKGKTKATAKKVGKKKAPAAKKTKAKK